MNQKIEEPILNEFKFITERALREDVVQITRHQSTLLRQKLPQGTYWLQPTGRLVLWNYKLLVDYLVNGDRPEHQALVEKFLATLPKSA
jgi:hypothetical protein